MKLNMTKIAAAMILLGSVGAHAAVAPASVTTQAADLVFNQPAGAVTVVINPAHDLVAGNIAAATELAAFTVTPNDTTANIAVRWTPGSGTISNTPRFMTVQGKNDPKHSLAIGIDGRDLVAVDEGWYYTPTAGVFNDNIITTTAGAQNVAADTYPVSLDAGVWTA